METAFLLKNVSGRRISPRFHLLSSFNFQLITHSLGVGNGPKCRKNIDNLSITKKLSKIVDMSKKVVENEMSINYRQIARACALSAKNAKIGIRLKKIFLVSFLLFIRLGGELPT